VLGGDAQPPSPPVSVRRHAAALRETPPPSRWTRGHVPGEVGVWVFIIGDMLVFALFFGVFMVERGNALEEFRAGRDTLDTAFGVINTLMLLTGSILVALAMTAVREGMADRAPRLLLGAMATGTVFLVDKVIEYADKFSAHITPGTNDFYTLFFVFTGIHALHLLIGLGALTYMRSLVRRGPPSGRDMAMMECCASYWHLVDLLWVVLFALFYRVA
jgi:nitric oxide reductase NorE protein